MVTSLVRVQQLLMERIDAVLRPLELTFARYEVLRLLSFSSAGAMPMTRLGSLLQVHPTSVTSAVDRLERQGFVERQRHDDDRRVVLAAITDAGRAVVEKATDGLNGEVFQKPGLAAAAARRPHRGCSAYSARTPATSSTDGPTCRDHPGTRVSRHRAARWRTHR